MGSVEGCRQGINCYEGAEAIGLLGCGYFVGGMVRLGWAEGGSDMISQVHRMDEEILCGLLQDLPVGLATARRLCLLLSEPEVSTHRIEAVLLVDPQMTAQLIRFANAASYGVRETVTSVNGALQVLGYAKVSRFVAARSFEAMLPKSFVLYPDCLDAFRHRSIACALAMDRLSNGGNEIGGKMYTIGLLHSFGQILVDRFYKESGLDLDISLFAGPNDRRLPAKERFYLGMDRANAAAIALRKWGFPEEIYRPIAWQYAPVKAGPFYEEAFNLSLARYIAGLIVEDSKGEVSARNARMNLAVGHWSLDKLFEQVEREMRSLGEWMKR